MVDGISAINGVDSTLNNLIVGPYLNTSTDNGISGSVQAKLKTFGIDPSSIKTEDQAKTAILEAQNSILAEVAKADKKNVDIEDTAEVSQSYDKRAEILRSLNK